MVFSKGGARCLRRVLASLFLVFFLASACGGFREPPRPREPEGAYPAYIRQAPEFRRVRQDPARFDRRWDTWVYMPWRYRWHVGTGNRGGRFCQEYGINGGVLDHGVGPLDWLERWGLRFYNDHTAGKGSLYLIPSQVKNLGDSLKDPRAVRPRPLTPGLLRELGGVLAGEIGTVRRSPLRLAWSLDDEISTGSFVRPIPWRLNEDDDAWRRWLSTYYGGNPPKAVLAGPDEVRGELDQPLREIDLSPFLDRMTYNDSVWADFIGRLVERCNQEDPGTPCGFVGGQPPNLWGGYDWAKLAGKVQFVEAYDLGSAPEIVRSFNPGIPRVSTHFHSEDRGVGNDKWLAWHHFAHGNRGMVAWVEGWFFPDGTPRPWLERFRSTLYELSHVQGKKTVGARWIGDGVAIYYSHPSIQVSWMLDSEPHGRTWPNRNDDARLGTSHNVRRAWEAILNDAGLQYDFLPYDQVVLHGVPPRYKVLILPAVYALSDAEARRIADFARNGGTVIADFACGLFDQHGRGRSKGALDDLFGVRHDGSETKKDFFGGGLWVETDQDKGFAYRKYRELLETVSPRLEGGMAVAERKLPVGTKRGRAVYLNLSPQRYLMHRQEGTDTEAQRRLFLQPVLDAGIRPWMQITSDVRLPKLETTAWSKDGRTLAFIVQNVPLVKTSESGGVAAEDLMEARVPIEVRLAGPVTGVLDERTGRPLPDGDRFRFEMDTTEAVFFSFQGPPPTRR
ncbi:MAG TPA: beta-galactosidase trimerization domain-containing protein [Thermoanaerobaculia bacterium]|nr:beta-galactosidase trimerization domain-containing protein [Thermoanaerobaculia bacterium]